MKKRILLYACIVAKACLLLSMPVRPQENTFPVLTGKYVENKPEKDATVFAKGIISTDGYEHSAPAFSPDGKTVTWGIVERDKPSVLLEMRKVDNKWTKPHPVSFSAQTSDDMYPAFSVDGKQLFFGSRRPLPGGAAINDIRLWVVNATAS